MARHAGGVRADPRRATARGGGGVGRRRARAGQACGADRSARGVRGRVSAGGTAPGAAHDGARQGRQESRRHAGVPGDAARARRRAGRGARGAAAAAVPGRARGRAGHAAQLPAARRGRLHRARAGADAGSWRATAACGGSRGPRASARRRWPCTRRIGWPSGIRTGSCSWTCTRRRGRWTRCCGRWTCRASGFPSPPEERAALWRAQVGGRRVVIVLDGVTSVSQVRQLLPGSPGCLTLITSRSRLCGLEGVHRVPLDVLNEQRGRHVARADPRRRPGVGRTRPGQGGRAALRIPAARRAHHRRASGRARALARVEARQRRLATNAAGSTSWSRTTWRCGRAWS